MATCGWILPLGPNRGWWAYGRRGAAGLAITSLCSLRVFFSSVSSCRTWVICACCTLSFPSFLTGWGRKAWPWPALCRVLAKVLVAWCFCFVSLFTFRFCFRWEAVIGVSARHKEAYQLTAKFISVFSGSLQCGQEPGRQRQSDSRHQILPGSREVLQASCLVDTHVLF